MDGGRPEQGLVGSWGSRPGGWGERPFVQVGLPLLLTWWGQAGLRYHGHSTPIQGLGRGLPLFWCLTMRTASWWEEGPWPSGAGTAPPPLVGFLLP